MNGIELSEAFYRQFGEPMLREKFPDLLNKIAVGVAGGGSDSYGFDDILSRDHDYSPGFCIFLPDENVVSRRAEFLLERAYSSLPDEFMGIKRARLSPVGGNRRGVMRISDFFMRTTGSPDGNLSDEQRLHIADSYMFEATNGKIFCDNYGLITEIRDRLKKIPEDVFLKKIAGCLIVMNQSGQYNFRRCTARGETAAAQLALYEFAGAAMKIAFTLENEYMPYYKWSFYALRRLKKFAFLAPMLEFLITMGNGEENIREKCLVIETVAEKTAQEAMSVTGAESGTEDLEKLAYAVNDKIKSGKIRNLNIFSAV